MKTFTWEKKRKKEEPTLLNKKKKTVTIDKIIKSQPDNQPGINFF